MTHAEIQTMLNAVAPTAYYQFPMPGQEPPFICFYVDGSSDLQADNINYQKVDRIVVELYTRDKDFSLESKIEEAFRNNMLTWERTEQFLDDERIWVEVYELNVIITEGNENAGY